MTSTSSSWPETGRCSPPPKRSACRSPRSAERKVHRPAPGEATYFYAEPYHQQYLAKSSNGYRSHSKSASTTRAPDPAPLGATPGHDGSIPIPTTKYATTPDGASIAYQQVGDTGPDLIFVTGGASHCELFWELPGWAHYLRRLGSFSRMVWFDKRGTGLSDRDVSTTAVEARMLDIGVVMDAVGVDRAVVVGMSEGAPMSALFAATFPGRVERLVLMAGMGYGGAVPSLPALAESAPTAWGTGLAMSVMWAHGVTDMDLLARIERSMGTPTAMGALARITMDFDVRSILPMVQAPTIVGHCVDDPVVPLSAGRELAELIPGATFVELPGDYHGSGRPDEMEAYAATVEEFVTGTVGGARRLERVLATVLFTDIVDSTARATAEGDRRWADLLDDHDRICTRAVSERGGRIVKMTGDGVLATFDGPAAAIGAAQAMVANLTVLGLAIRAGVHTGEIERRDDDIGGVGVNLAARVMGAAGDGEVWVSSTVPGLSAGSGISFTSQGKHVLKGIDDAQELHLARRSA